MHFLPGRIGFQPVSHISSRKRRDAKPSLRMIWCALPIGCSSAPLPWNTPEKPKMVIDPRHRGSRFGRKRCHRNVLHKKDFFFFASALAPFWGRDEACEGRWVVSGGIPRVAPCFPTRGPQAGDWGMGLFPGPAVARPTPLRSVWAGPSAIVVDRRGGPVRFSGSGHPPCSPNRARPVRGPAARSTPLRSVSAGGTVSCWTALPTGPCSSRDRYSSHV